MKITLSPLVAALHGRAGGAVCAVTRGVQYVKKHARPGGPPSAAQLAHRAHVERLGRWWRSLPVEVRTFLNAQGVAQGSTGFALFTRTMVSMHSVTYDCTIIGDNPSLQHIYKLTCRAPYAPNYIQVDWEISHAIPTYYVHFFSMPYVAPTSETDYEDVITYHPACTALVLAEFAQVTGLVSHTEYWIVGCVAKHRNMPDNTVFSGGWADVGSTHA